MSIYFDGARAEVRMTRRGRTLWIPCMVMGMNRYGGRSYYDVRDHPDGGTPYKIGTDIDGDALVIIADQARLRYPKE